MCTVDLKTGVSYWQTFRFTETLTTYDMKNLRAVRLFLPCPTTLHLVVLDPFLSNPSRPCSSLHYPYVFHPCLPRSSRHLISLLSPPTRFQSPCCPYIRKQWNASLLLLRSPMFLPLMRSAASTFLSSRWYFRQLQSFSPSPRSVPLRSFHEPFYSLSFDRSVGLNNPSHTSLFSIPQYVLPNYDEYLYIHQPPYRLRWDYVRPPPIFPQSISFPCLLYLPFHLLLHFSLSELNM